MIRALLHSVGQSFNSDGAWWILALDGILLIPLVFAMFFFPVAVLIGVGRRGGPDDHGGRAHALHARTPPHP